MFKPKMIENQNNLHCQNKHGQPVHLVVLDPKLDKKQRLLCTDCMENFESDAKTIGVKKIIQIIEDNIKQTMSDLEGITQQTVQQLQICKRNIQELKAYFMKLFDSLISIAEEWTQNLFTLIQQSKQYNLYDESWMAKLLIILNQYIQDKDKVNFNEIKQKFTNIICSIHPQKRKIRLKLIDYSVKQSVGCQDIVFDSSGSIIVSTQSKDIKVWSFLNGKIQLTNILQGLLNGFNVQFIVRNRILLFQVTRPQDAGNNRTQVIGQVHNLIKNIKICNLIYYFLEVMINQLKYGRLILIKNIDIHLLLYQHYNEVLALSLNQSETLLVSCAGDDNEIIIGKEENKLNEIYNIEGIKYNKIYNDDGYKLV
ncbi:unnamed protein product [Paramecium pentaurelia]|uniref:Uncharacterized protein n=1 Tax=Paramecium pentaurelia TaxID=43138 RepID=A0A8S1VM95_9CILI|nr:unnamed protein product [Paramecium pentaurelia]